MRHLGFDYVCVDAFLHAEQCYFVAHLVYHLVYVLQVLGVLYHMVVFSLRVVELREAQQLVGGVKLSQLKLLLSEELEHAFEI